MANETTTPAATEPESNESAENQLPDERSLLMQRARLMGIKFSNNIGTDALKLKIEAHMTGEREVEQPAPLAPAALAEIPPQMAEEIERPMTQQKIRQKLVKEATKLVRIRVTCLDPKKKDLPGEIFTVANKFIGTVRKFIPFGEATDNGYHVPHCLYTMLKDRKFLHIRTVGKHGRERVVTSYEREFAIEVLPQLTEPEIRKLAASQAAKAGGDQ